MRVRAELKKLKRHIHKNKTTSPPAHNQNKHEDSARASHDDDVNSDVSQVYYSPTRWHIGRVWCNFSRLLFGLAGIKAARRNKLISNRVLSRFNKSCLGNRKCLSLSLSLFFKRLTHTQERRTPFHEEEEEAILLLFRQRASWPCFPAHLDIGRTYRARGFHEKARQRLETTTFSENSAGILPTETIKEIIRFTIIGKSGWCRRAELAMSALAVADGLCNTYALHNAIVLVCDFTQKLASDRILAQSMQSINLLGFGAETVERSIFLHDNVASMLLAIGSAYDQPGLHFKIDNQLLLCNDGVQRQGTVMYVVDPASFFLIISAADQW